MIELARKANFAMESGKRDYPARRKLTLRNHAVFRDQSAGEYFIGRLVRGKINPRTGRAI